MFKSSLRIQSLLVTRFLETSKRPGAMRGGFVHSVVQELLFVVFLFICMVRCYRFKLKTPNTDYYEQERDSEEEVKSCLLNTLYQFVLNCYFVFLKLVLQ